ncbi:MAG TPA: hypothetical protein VGL34_25270 [Steroidobacteraceae bacterium]|jgi:hypothetical protein
MSAVLDIESIEWVSVTDAVPDSAVIAEALVRANVVEQAATEVA